MQDAAYYRIISTAKASYDSRPRVINNRVSQAMQSSVCLAIQKQSNVFFFNVQIKSDFFIHSYLKS